MRTEAVESTSSLDDRTRAFYCSALRLLTEEHAPFLVGGAYAFQRYTGIERHTKDLDIFVRPQDCEQILNILDDAGYHTELTYPHWLGKVFSEDTCVDIIFSSGNGIATVDDIWFKKAVSETVLDQSVKLIPVEEMIWSKSFVLERERYDGADIAHLLRAHAGDLDWDHLLTRFDRDWPVLYSHLVLFSYTYPGELGALPPTLMHKLAQRLETTIANPSCDARLCNGTILSREQYLIDIHEWGYQDARVERNVMSPHSVEHWTRAIEDH